MAIDNQASKHMKPLVMKYYVIQKFLNVDPRKQLLDIAHKAPLATTEPRSDVRGLKSTSGYLLEPPGASWSLKPSGHSPEVAHDDSIGA